MTGILAIQAFQVGTVMLSLVLSQANGAAKHLS